LRPVTRFGRWLALAGWAGTLALPAVGLPRVAAAGLSPLAAEVCTADGMRTPPAGHHESGVGDGCSCCTSCSPFAPPFAAPLRIARSTAGDRHAVMCGASLVAAVAALPPSRGPPA
jgi:hypothetical protein